MNQQRLGWLTVVIGSVLLCAILAIAPGPSAQASELSAEPAIMLASPAWAEPTADTAVLAHTADITFTPAYTAHLPLIAYELPFQPAGIYGQVTYLGAPIDGVEIQLMLWNHVGNSWISNSGDTRYATTQAGGRYQFTTAASLNSNQKYTVKFGNSANDSRFLASWQSTSIYTYTAGQVLAGGDFEIAEMVYLSPSNYANVGLPVTFQWQPRVGSPSDSYMLELFKSNSSSPWFDTPQLGYVGSYTVNNLPTGFTTGVQYGWYVWVFGPGDSYGITNQYGWVTFH